MTDKATSRSQSEADLCDLLMAHAKTEGFVAYPETAGWDVLLVCGETGGQIGVEAKLKPNVKVLSQALRPDEHRPGPDVHAVLLPKMPSQDFVAVALACRLAILAPAHWRHWPRAFCGGVGPLRADLESSLRRWKHPSRAELPRIVPAGRAGLPAPVRWTKWKDAAMRICARLEVRGQLTSRDFRDVGISSTVWVQKGWIVDSGRKDGRRIVYVAGGTPLPSVAHAAEYTGFLEAERRESLVRGFDEWIDSESGRAGVLL